ncbi:MAG: hypothetical protein WA902_10465 [Thermosynechococcaceae cyanobacterium]
MKFYRSFSVIVIVVVIWFTLCLGFPEVLAVEGNQFHSDISQVQRYATKLTPLRIEILKLKPLIERGSWSEVKSLIRGPLGEFTMRLSFLEGAFPLSERTKVSRITNNLSDYLIQIDSSANVGNIQQSLETFQALTNELDGLLHLAGISDLSNSQDSFATASQQERQTKTNSKKTQYPSQDILPKISVEERIDPSLDPNLKNSRSVMIKDASQLGKSRYYSLTERRNIGKNKMSPDLTFIALIFLIPLTIYLQIRYQEKDKESQAKVADLEREIEALTQDKAELGGSVEKIQGRLVEMFMHLEETKPLARFRQKRAVTIEEQEQLIQENDSFVQALLKQAQAQIAPEDQDHSNEV